MQHGPTWTQSSSKRRACCMFSLQQDLFNSTESSSAWKRCASLSETVLLLILRQDVLHSKHRCQTRANRSSERDGIFMFVVWQDVWTTINPVASWACPTCSTTNWSWNKSNVYFAEISAFYWLSWIVYCWQWTDERFSGSACCSSVVCWARKPSPGCGWTIVPGSWNGERCLRSRRFHMCVENLTVFLCILYW